ncbi:MAG: helix-turn-helix domain-containing protein [Propionibacteriaceae bacterium]|nr:helix-turn-helix domain-containing protein [Propionibacteriaceae bacterium]
MEFAARLNEARTSKHLSINDVAKLAGIPKATVQGWLNGRHLPTPALRLQYLRMVDALGLADELPAGLWLDEWAQIEPRLRSGSAPYVGLRPFGSSDVELYHGRDQEARRLATSILALHRSRRSGVVALLGASGSGKSSLLAAGLVGHECVDGVLAGWSVRLLGPETVSDGAVDADLVIVDQFEEYLQLPDADRERAVRDLGRHAAERIVVVALRSDAFAVASAEPLLAEALARPVLVSPLTRAELREVILGPAAVAGVEVDQDLVHVLVNDLAPGPEQSSVPADVLPLLSNALLLTWAAGAGTRMTMADYRSVGGVAGAVETLAEEVFTGLDTHNQEIAQRLFLRLLGIAQDVVVRRPVPLDDLAGDYRPVLDAFVAARMLTVSDEQVRISHEALLRHWARLADWIEEHRAELDAVAKLRRAAELWRDTDRDPNVLIPVQRLPMFTEWLGDPGKRRLLGANEQAFLTASEQHFASELDEERRMTRRLRRQRRLALGLSIVTTLAAVVAGTSFVRGESIRADAQSRQIAIAARQMRSKSPNLLTQMALVSRQLADTSDARSIVLDASSMDAPIRWLGKPNAVLAVSPDGELVARADGTGLVTLWRGAEIGTSPGKGFLVDMAEGGLQAIALARVGARAVLAVGGSEVRSLWDVTAEPTKLVDLPGPGGTTAVAFNPQGDRVVFGSEDGGATVYDIEVLSTPAVVASVRHDKSDGQTSGVAIDGAGTLYLAGRSGAVDRWRISSGPVELAPLSVTVASANGRLPVRAQALALNRAGTELAVSVAGNEVERWTIEAGTPHPEPALTGFSSWTNAVWFSPDGSTLGVASSDQSISLFAEDGTLQRRMDTPAVQTGGGFADGGRVVGVGSDGTLLVWSAQSPLWKRSGSVIYNLSADSTDWLAGGSATDGIALWRLGATRKRMPKPQPPELGPEDYQVGAVAVAPNGSYLLGSSMKGKVLSWPLTDSGAGTGRAFDSGVGVSIIYTAVSPDSSLVAAMSARASKIVLLRADGAGGLSRRATIPVASPQLIGFSSDGQVLAIAQGDNTVSLWAVADPSNPAQVGSISLASTPTTITMSPSSQRIAIGEATGEVSVWDISEPAEAVRERTWDDATSDMYSLAFSPDATLLAGTSGDDIVWGWRLDSTDTDASFALSGDIGRPWDVRFIDGGARFAVAGDSGAVRVWDSDPTAAARSLCSRLGDQLTAAEWRRYLPGVEPRPEC